MTYVWLTKVWRLLDILRKSYKATVLSAEPVARTHSFFGLKAKQFTCSTRYLKHLALEQQIFSGIREGLLSHSEGNLHKYVKKLNSQGNLTSAW